MPQIGCDSSLEGGVAPPAPCFYPSQEDFEDPLRYINSIRPLAEPFGICRIRPPAGWKPPYAMDRETFRFKTRVQSVHELYNRRGGSSFEADGWHRQYDAYLATFGKKRLKRNNTLHGAEIELPTLHKAVSKRGGYDNVVEKRLWKDVARIVGMIDLSTLAAYNLRLMYKEKLLPYDLYLEAEGKQTAHGGAAEEAAPASFGNREACCPPKKRIKPEAKPATPPTPPPNTSELLGEEEEGDDERVPENIDDLLCDLCHGGHYEDQIILCDRCDHGVHMFCLSPPLEQVPEGEWLCPSCKEQDTDSYCFKEGQECNLDEFKAIAEDFKKHYTASLAATLGKKPEELTWQDLEHEFWRIVECADEPVEVLYGADLDTGRCGSGFPLQPDSMDDDVAKYSKHVWNINNFPLHSGQVPSLLRHIEDKITGVMVPWMYVGMMYSAFCWHIEDHMFYSINYMHWGEAKRWYGVPSYATPLFEAAFKEWLPEKMANQPDLLFQLVTMLSPEKLMKSGVPVYGVVQEEGDFVITFPSAFHGGFNCGFNCAEAVNFCPPDWLRFGSASQERYRHFRRPPVISLEELMYMVASQQELSPEAAAWVAIEMDRIARDERDLRTNLWHQGVAKAVRVTQPTGMIEGQEEDPECCVCRAILNYSAVQCSNPKCDRSRLVCLHHHDQLCGCSADRLQLRFRYTCADLDKATKRVQALSQTASRQPDWKPSRKAFPGSAMSGGAQHAYMTSGMHESKLDNTPVVKDEKTAQDNTATTAEASPRPAVPSAGAEEKPTTPPATEPCSTLVKEDDEPKAPLSAVGIKRARSPDSEAKAEVQAKSKAAAEFSRLDMNLLKRDELLDTFIAAPAVGADDSKRAEILEAYSEWKSRSEAMLLDGSSKMTDLKEMIHEGGSYIWGWEDMQDAPRLLEALEEAWQWGRSCNALCGKKNSMEHVEALVMKDPPPVAVGGLKKLRESVLYARQVLPRLQALSKQMEDNSAPRPTLADLEQAIALAIANYAIEFPLAKQLQVHSRAANRWATKVRKIMPPAAVQGKSKPPRPVPTTLEQIEGLLTEAKGIRVDMPQVAGLQAARVALQGSLGRIREVTGSRPTVASLTKVLEAVKQATNVVTAELDAASDLLKRMQKWEACTQQVLESDSIDDLPYASEMREHLTTGESMEADLAGINGLRTLVRQQEWKEAVANVCSGGKHTVQLVADLLSSADSIGCAQAGQVDMLKAKHEAAVKMTEKLKQLAEAVLLPDGHQAVGSLESATSEAEAQGLQSDLCERALAILDNLRCLTRKVSGVLEPAAGKDRPPAQVLADLLSKTDGVPLEPTLLSKLQERKASAGQWLARAQELLASPGESAVSSASALMQGVSSLGVSFPEEVPLSRLGEAARWNKEVLAGFRPGDASIPRPMVGHAEQWVKAAAELVVDTDLLRALTEATGKAAEWTTRISSALACGRAGKRLSSVELQAAQAEARGFTVEPEGLERLSEVLEASCIWEERTAKRLAEVEAQDRCLTPDELGSIVEEGTVIPVASPQLEKLHRCLAKTEDWEAAVKQCLVKRGSHAKMDDLLASLERSTANFLALIEQGAPKEALEAALVHRPLRAELKRYSVHKADLPGASTCLCMEVEQEGGGSWICCDNCSTWTHLRCAGVSQAEAKAMKKYSCATCIATKPGTTCNEAVTGEAAMMRLRRTKGPSIEALQAVLASGQKLMVKSKLEARLGSALACYETASAALEMTLAQQDKSMASEGRALTHAESLQREKSLRLLLKAALICEVDSKELGNKTLQAIRLLRWRSRADNTLFRVAETAITGPEGIKRIIQDGEALGLVAQDSWPLRELSSRSEAAQSWLDRSKEMLAHSMAGGAVTTAKMKELIEEGELLKKTVKVDKLLTEMQEAVMRYCYCQELYNRERAMLACSLCSEWYHFECVGLAALDAAADSDAPNCPTSFRCPTCRAMDGKQLKNLSQLPECTRAAVRAAMCSQKADNSHRPQLSAKTPMATEAEATNGPGTPPEVPAEPQPTSGVAEVRDKPSAEGLAPMEIAV